MTADARTYTVHLRLIGKLVNHFLFVLTELLSLGVTVRLYTSEDGLQIGVFEEGWSVSVKISRSRGRPPCEPFLHR